VRFSWTYCQPKDFPVPGRFDRGWKPLRRKRSAAKFYEHVFDLKRREARHDRLALVLFREDVGDDTILPGHGPDQEERLLGLGRPTGVSIVSSPSQCLLDHGSSLPFSTSKNWPGNTWAFSSTFLK
jgi:hypothetical protein